MARNDDSVEALSQVDGHDDPSPKRQRRSKVLPDPRLYDDADTKADPPPH